MAPHGLRSPIVRWSGGLLAGVAMVAAVSGVIALLAPHVPVLSLLELYLLAVLPVAVVWGAPLAAVTSVAGAAAFALLFLHPAGGFWVAEQQSAVALGVFLVTAVVVGQLAARTRRAAERSARLTDEQAALRRVATLVARADAPSAVFEAVTREVGRLSGADLARMERYERDGSVTGVAVWSRVPHELAVGTRFALEGLSVARDVRRTGAPVRLESFAGATGQIAEEARATGIRSSVGCPVVVAGRLWGVVAASTKREAPFPENTESQIASFTELVATAVENAEGRAELRRMADLQAGLRRVATLVARGVAPDAVFAAVAQEVTQHVGAEMSAIFRFDSETRAVVLAARGPAGEDMSTVGTPWKPEPPSALASVLATGRAARYDADTVAHQPEYLRERGIRSTIAVPITVEGRSWGAISVYSRRDPFPPDTEPRLADFTELAAMAIANAEAHAKLTRSRARIVATADETRRRIERDLHDGAQQRLVSLALELRVMQRKAPAEAADLRAGIAQAAEDLAAVSEQLREISHGIHPAVLSQGGLGPALGTLARRSAVPVQVSIATARRFPPPMEVAVYYVVAEALTNTAKHADASRAEVAVREQDGVLRLRVADDGVGGARAQDGSGLTGLRDRVEALGGSIEVRSPADQGTVIEVSLPIDPADGGTAPEPSPGAR
jgi:signal transduction histidine kinase